MGGTGGTPSRFHLRFPLVAMSFFWGFEPWVKISTDSNITPRAFESSMLASAKAQEFVKENLSDAEANVE